MTSGPARQTFVARVGGAAMRFVVVMLALPIYLYRYLVSPMLPPACRFQPSCSEYALEALRVHGPVAGVLLAVRRVARCHPWGGWGFDPVPARGAANFRNREPCCDGKALPDPDPLQ